MEKSSEANAEKFMLKMRVRIEKLSSGDFELIIQFHSGGKSLP